jgi:hypothetical protein
MALLFASAASIVPRFIEHMGETNSIVAEYMENNKSPEEEIRQAAWIAAINRIKCNGAWHSGLVAIKIFGDSTFLFTAGKLLYEWLYEIFIFLRQVCPQSKEDLITQSSTIKDRVMKFYQNLSEMYTSVKAANTAAAVGGNTILPQVADSRLSPTNLLTHLWKILNNSYICVAQWMYCLIGKLTFEMTKYAIQLCGCISYYLELLDKTWNFGLN